MRSAAARASDQRAPQKRQVHATERRAEVRSEPVLQVLGILQLDVHREDDAGHEREEDKDRDGVDDPVALRDGDEAVEEVALDVKVHRRAHEWDTGLPPCDVAEQDRALQVAKVLDLRDPHRRAGVQELERGEQHETEHRAAQQRLVVLVPREVIPKLAHEDALRE